VISDWVGRLDRRLSQGLRDGVADGRLAPFLTAIAHSGDSVVVLPCLGILWWMTGLAFSGTFFLGIAGVLLSMACVALAKQAFRRARPVGDWGALCRKADPHSFPSGHAARSMALATAMMFVAGPAWGLPLFAWAILLGVTRVALGMHWLFDVFAGWAVGIVSGFAAVSLLA
jgi:undecaprenyl-diphosphatase